MAREKKPRSPRTGHLSGPRKLGKSDRYPSDYGVRDQEDASWQPGDKGQGREGLHKGYGGSGGKGTAAPGPAQKKGKRQSSRQ